VLTDHRRAFWWAVALLSATVFIFVAVGRHPPAAAPETTLPFLGRWDLAIAGAMDDIRTAPLTAVARLLNLLGSGVVTIPFRIAVALWLLSRTRWRALAAWLLTWAVAETTVWFAKDFFHRGRPPGSLVETVGFSFPSGHAVAGASIAVAFVLVLLAPGRERRRWEVAAAGFAFVMACSRVYLLAHWFTDVLAGVLLGTAIALGCTAFVTEIHDVALQRRQRQTVPDG
jgi:undecaprenyl-diphosphatase